VTARVRLPVHRAGRRAGDTITIRLDPAHHALLLALEQHLGLNRDLVVARALTLMFVATPRPGDH
jgi:hypothetical protein